MAFLSTRLSDSSPSIYVGKKLYFKNMYKDEQCWKIWSHLKPRFFNQIVVNQLNISDGYMQQPKEKGKVQHGIYLFYWWNR